MPTFSYTAKSLKGEGKSGTMQATDKVEVARYLREQGFVPIKIEEKDIVGERAVREGGILRGILSFNVGRTIDSIRGVSLPDKVMFSRHLAVMISAGVPIIRALEVLSRQTRNELFKTAIARISEDIRSGERLADALAKHARVFDSLYISMVRSGDAAGNLTEILELLGEHLKKEHDLKSRIKGAMMYPSVVMVAMGGIGALMMTMVVPKIAEIFDDLEVELPLSTRLVIGTSNFISAYWLFILIALPFFFYGAKKAAGTGAGKKLFSWVFLRLPVMSGLTRKINSARFARTLSSLVEGGVPILKGLEITADTLGNFYYKQSMREVHEKVKGGATLYESIAPYENIYPGLVVQMVQVGEETGALGRVLIRIAEFYEEEVNNATKNLSSIIEPILMLVMGVVVGIFAVSMIQPMYSLMGNI